MIASFPMYDLPELRGDLDTFWAALALNLRRQGVEDVPVELSRNCPVRDLWGDPDLFISQCCGFDVIRRYKSKLKPIATPKYAAYGCFEGNYCSIIVTAQDSTLMDVRDAAGKIAVINGPESHSGMSSLRHLVAPRQSQGLFFSEVKVSGSHTASLAMIQNGEAEIAAIDSVSLTLLRRHRKGIFDGLKILGTTYAAPAPPFVVKSSVSNAVVGKIRDAFLHVFDDPSLKTCRESLLLDGIVLTQQDDYWIHEAFEDHALKNGLPMV